MMENNDEMQAESSAKGGASSKGNENERGDEDSSEFDGTEDEERLDQVPGNYCFYIALIQSYLCMQRSSLHAVHADESLLARQLLKN